MFKDLDKFLGENEIGFSGRDRLYLGVLTVETSLDVSITGKRINPITEDVIGTGSLLVCALDTNGEIPEDPRLSELLYLLEGQTVGVYFSVGLPENFLIVIYEGGKKIDKFDKVDISID